VSDAPPPASAFDVAVIGGGIVGCGIARDAARRGLTVALLEKRDFGSGTTSASTRLAHGGLRYLETFDFKLVRLDLREREILLKIAPHLVKPLPFLLPLPRSWWGRQRLKIGMRLYDWLSYDKSLPNHRIVGLDELRQLEPALDTTPYSGAALFYDAQVHSPERLALENVIDASEHGASVWNYTEVTEAIHENGRVAGVKATHTLTGETREVRARLVVNATGPWFDAVAARIERPHAPRVRMTKGILIACEPFTTHALVLASGVDGRVVFAIPWSGYTWIGTTDTDFEGDPADAVATPEDVQYMVDSLAPHLPAVRDAKKYWTMAGVRALVREEGSESEVSRMHQIATDTPGLISVIGGKLTGYRAIAEEVVDAACRQLGHTAPCTTDTTPLPGGGPERSGDAHLDAIYGSRAPRGRALSESDADLQQRLAPNAAALAGQVAYAVRHEFCARLEDFQQRRSYLSFLPDQGSEALSDALRVMQQELGWHAARLRSEADAVRARATLRRDALSPAGVADS
jgi:glycerol-3-phosphate dehydrogenase